MDVLKATAVMIVKWACAPLVIGLVLSYGWLAFFVVMLSTIATLYLMVLYIMACVVLAFSSETSSVSRRAAICADYLTSAMHDLTFIQFCFGITMFGFPLILAYMLATSFIWIAILLLYAPLYVLEFLNRHVCPKAFAVLREAAAFNWYCFMSRLDRLRDGIIMNSLSVTSIPVVRALLWTCVNGRAMDHIDLAISRMKQRIFHPLSILRRIANMVSIAILSYLNHNSTDSFSSTLILLPFVYTFVVFRRYQKVYTGLLDAYRRVERNGLSLALQSNSRAYGTMFLTPEKHINSDSQATIRLLTLLPGSRRDSLECLLDEVLLFENETPEFEALSYVWGRDIPGNSIIINGGPFVVSDSVHQALLHLRHAREPRTLWIDAICINQCDLDERAEQVLLMPTIYSRAKRVLVWLGNRVPFGLHQTLENISAFWHNSKAGPEGEDSGIHYVAVKAVIDLLQHPWWTRVWVVQEIVVARQAFIVCGGHKIDWDGFCRLVHFVASHPSFRQHSRDAHFEEFQALEAYRRKRSGTAHPDAFENDVSLFKGAASDVLSPIFDFRMRDATDVRDKLFALQGVIDTPILQKPDYTNEPCELTIEFAKQHIQTFKSLAILNLAECAQQWGVAPPGWKPSDSVLDGVLNQIATRETVAREGFVPSWCPAFMSPQAIKDSLHRTPLWTGLPGDDHLGPFSATDNIPLPKEIMSGLYDGEHAYKLPIAVLSDLRDTVTAVGPVYNPSMSRLKHDMLQVLLRRLPNAHSSLAGLFDNKKVLDEWQQLSSEAYKRRRSLDSTSCHQTPCNDRENFDLTLHGGKQWDGSSDRERSALREATCTGRHFFTTDRGLSGLGPEGLSVGDEIHVVLGCQVPVALRNPLVHWLRHSYTPEEGCQGQDEKDLVYVGQVYIHELMVYEGDLSEDISTGKVTLGHRFLV